jgi:hypothetical protein
LSEIPFSPYNGKGFTLYNGINQINLSMDLVQKQSADPRYYTLWSAPIHEAMLQRMLHWTKNALAVAS